MGDSRWHGGAPGVRWASGLCERWGVPVFENWPIVGYKFGGGSTVAGRGENWRGFGANFSKAGRKRWSQKFATHSDRSMRKIRQRRRFSRMLLISGPAQCRLDGRPNRALFPDGSAFVLKNTPIGLMLNVFLPLFFSTVRIYYIVYTVLLQWNT